MNTRMRSWIVAGLLLATARADAALIDSFGYGSHWYQIYSDTNTWLQSHTFATATIFGGATGYLARVNDAAEDAAIYARLQLNNASFTARAGDGGGARYVWIGASDRGVEGTWTWSNNGDQFWSGPPAPAGNPVGGLYNNWGTVSGTQYEPDDAGGQDAAGIGMDPWPFPIGVLGSAGQWNDINEANTMPFVVEFDVVPEPSTLLLALSALSLLAFRRRAGA